jgi:hypothetical protein
MSPTSYQTAPPRIKFLLLKLLSLTILAGLVKGFLLMKPFCRHSKIEATCLIYSKISVFDQIVDLLPETLQFMLRRNSLARAEKNVFAPAVMAAENFKHARRCRELFGEKLKAHFVGRPAYGRGGNAYFEGIAVDADNLVY